jgi:YidC/Oxa1 family membrane protein insertase
MEKARLFIAIALSFLVFFLWNVFFVEKETVEPPTGKTLAPIIEMEESFDKKEQLAEKEEVKPVKTARTIQVNTPLYTVKISEKGSAIKSFVLKRYREQIELDSPLKEIVSKNMPDGTLLMGFAGKSIPGLDRAVFSADLPYDSVDIVHGSEPLIFSWVSPNGIVVKKEFFFSPETYLIELTISVKNNSNEALRDNLVLSLMSTIGEQKSRFGFEGPSLLLNNKLKQIKMKKIEEKNIYSGKLGWIALQDRYFMSSIISEKNEEASMRLFLKPDHILEAEFLQPEQVIQPGSEHFFDFELFFGPKSMTILNDLGYNLGKAVNFGMFDFIAKPCVWLMNFFYRFIPNYGVAIIILTLMTKVLLWPLGSKSYKSMSEMKKLQPLIAELKEKYKNDRKKIQQETMALYKTYKINPLGGCLPMVAQIPVFFALYRMLYEAIELRHAPFFGWIRDLSAPDRLFRFDFSVPFMEPPYGIPVLTIIMGASMLLQQRMSPPPGDPAQAKMMMLMPIVFTVIFINFSSGLVLYWLVNNVLSISQQYYVSKKTA